MSLSNPQAHKTRRAAALAVTLSTALQGTAFAATAPRGAKPVGVAAATTSTALASSDEIARAIAGAASQTAGSSSAVASSVAGTSGVANAAPVIAAATSVKVAVSVSNPGPDATPSFVPVVQASPSVIFAPRDLSGLVLPPAPAIPAPSADPLQNGVPSGDLVGNTGPFVGISSSDVVAMTLARNTDLSISQSNRRIARYQIVAAQGVYDLRFELEPSFSLADDASVSAFQAGPSGVDEHQITRGLSASIGENTTSGGTVKVTTSAQGHFDDSAVDSFNDFYTTSLGITATQPLIRGRKIDDNRRQIQLARVNADLSNDNALLTASNSISSSLTAYNNLISAWKNVAIQEDALRQAKAQSESNARLVRRGQSAPVDVVESDTQVDVFQDNVYAAIQNVASLQNELKELILSDPADPIWSANLVPITPLDVVPPEPALNDVIVSALSKRPEVSQLREQIRSADVNVAYDRDQTLPQLDFSVGASENGFAGVPAPFAQNPFVPILGAEDTSIDQLIARSNADNPGLAALPFVQTPSLGVYKPFQVGNIGTSYSSLFAGRYPQISANVTLGFPIQNRTAKADLKIAQEQRRQVKIDEVALVQRVQLESRNAVQAFRSARSRLIAARAARVAAERVYASELRKFRAGQSTNFLVLQREIELANDRGRELQSETDLQNALVTIDHVSGDLLTKNDVQADALGTAPTVTTPAAPYVEASPAAK